MGKKKDFFSNYHQFSFQKKYIYSRNCFCCNHIHIYVLAVFYATTKKLIEINKPYDQ